MQSQAKIIRLQKMRKNFFVAFFRHILQTKTKTLSRVRLANLLFGWGGNEGKFIQD
jgi:hypothetical protein